MCAEHTRDEIVLCPPFVQFPQCWKPLRGSKIGVGGQDMFWESEGAYTGAVSAQMLHAVGCSHVIIGHSERRQYFGETDDTVNRKLRAALVVGLKPIVCVGEVLQEREAGVTEDILRRQCSIAFARYPAAAPIPLWWLMNRSGRSARARRRRRKLAAEAHRVIRAQAAEAFGDDVAAKMRILVRWQRQAGKREGADVTAGNRWRAGRRRQPGCQSRLRRL